MCFHLLTGWGGEREGKGAFSAEVGRCPWEKARWTSGRKHRMCGSREAAGGQPSRGAGSSMPCGGVKTWQPAPVKELTQGADVARSEDVLMRVSAD